jgi:hypothetical protein
MTVAAVAPCQCLWPGGHQTTSPARISTFASPSRGRRVQHVDADGAGEALLGPFIEGWEPTRFSSMFIPFSVAW